MFQNGEPNPVPALGREAKEEKALVRNVTNENNGFLNGICTPANFQEFVQQASYKGVAFDFNKIAPADFLKVRNLLEVKYQQWLEMLSDPDTINKMNPKNEKHRQELGERLQAAKNKGFPFILTINNKQSAEHMQFIFELLNSKLVSGFIVQDVISQININRLTDCFINNSYLTTADFYGISKVETLTYQQANKLLAYLKQGPVLPITLRFNGSHLIVDQPALTYEDRLKFDLIKGFAKLDVCKDSRSLDIRINNNALFHMRREVEKTLKHFSAFESSELEAKDSTKVLEFENLRHFQPDDLQKLADYIVALNKPENPGVKIILDFDLVKCDSDMWYAFLEKICKHGKIISVDISGNPRGSLPLTLLFQNLMKNQTLKTLNLSRLNLKAGEPNEGEHKEDEASEGEHKEDEPNQSEHITALKHLISTDENNLEALYFTNCELDRGSANTLDHALRLGRKKLIELSISNCRNITPREYFHFSPNAVYSIIEENVIKKLCIENFLVPMEDPDRLRRSLAVNTSLQELSIGSNGSHNISMLTILANHPNLTSLRVSGLKKHGAFLLLNSIYYNTKLLHIAFEAVRDSQHDFLGDKEINTLRDKILNRNKALLKEDFVGITMALYQGARQGAPGLSADVASRVCSFFIPVDKAHHAIPAEERIAARCGFLAEAPKAKAAGPAQAVVPEDKDEESIHSRTPLMSNC